MQFLASLPTFADDPASQAVWGRLLHELRELDGICYYRHPIIAWATVPDLTILARGYDPIAIRCLGLSLGELEELGESSWTISGNLLPSPLVELDDYTTGLQQRFDRERALRRRLRTRGVVAFPAITRNEFVRRFPHATFANDSVLWSDLDVSSILTRCASPLSDREWTLAKSVLQGINVLNRPQDSLPETSPHKGSAIRIIEREIALLDEEQHKVAIQIAPGPQRVRGLAGTGKTVVLAMKAANIHLRYPEKRILFTFNTQSLYNQAKSLISRFYRAHSDADPNWDVLHIRHAWGSANRPGVYYDLCRAAAVAPLDFRRAAGQDPIAPFRACCRQAMGFEITETYDHVLIDEAQDFPREFFELLYRVTKTPKAICFAYDELQSLARVDIPTATEMFGVDADGNPRVSLDGEYPGGIEKDFVLHRSYRCPREVLMLAHGLGLGIHAPRGCVQMLANRGSWVSIGYEVTRGNLLPGEETEICRPADNSPNRILTVYTGGEQIIVVRSFDDRSMELEWVANAIAADVAQEGVAPDQIIVISLDSPKKVLSELQSRLLALGIRSKIPGLVDRAWEFAEPGMVTLATKFRAKGNEAPVVYIVAFETLSVYAEEVEARNGAFTSISRSKGFVRISGSGRAMKSVEAEMDLVLRDIPCFRFRFPDPARLRLLDASETTRRRREVRRAQESAKALTEVDREAVAALNPDVLRRLKEMLEELDPGEDR